MVIVLRSSLYMYDLIYRKYHLAVGENKWSSFSFATSEYMQNYFFGQNYGININSLIPKQKSIDSSILRGKLVPNGAWFNA